MRPVPLLMVDGVSFILSPGEFSEAPGDFCAYAAATEPTKRTAASVVILFFMSASFYGTQINVLDVAGFRRNGLGTREYFWHLADIPVALSDFRYCSHALIDQADGSRVRVIKASEDWPVEQVRRSMKKG